MIPANATIAAAHSDDYAFKFANTAAYGDTVVSTDNGADQIPEPRADTFTVAESLGAAYGAAESRPDIGTVAEAFISAIVHTDDGADWPADNGPIGSTFCGTVLESHQRSELGTIKLADAASEPDANIDAIAATDISADGPAFP